MKRTPVKSRYRIFAPLINLTPDYRNIFLTGLLVLLVLFGRVSFSDENSPVKPYAFRDFGYLPQNAEVGHTFFVYNTDSDSLRVNRIESGCSCTSVSKIERPIPPGDSAAVKVIFKSGRYHHRVSKTTKVYTNDTIAPVRHLRITAFVFKKGEETGSVSLTPAVLKWKNEKSVISPIADTLHIVNRGDRNMQIAVEHYPEELFETITVPGDIAPGQTVNLVLEVLSKTITVKPEGLSLTLAFIGADTTRVTVPLEIKN
ncbi:MAG: DUF1573 domain-containing protein [candidate division Zixibacteria bacterium]|nr:DUF1573 domain-containing protein [candidate division Zixibacteria bacterium]